MIFKIPFLKKFKGRNHLFKRKFLKIKKILGEIVSWRDDFLKKNKNIIIRGEIVSSLKKKKIVSLGDNFENSNFPFPKNILTNNIFIQ